MKPSAVIPALTALITLICACAAAKDALPPAVASRPCAQEDLAGVYAMVEFRETPRGDEAQMHGAFSHEYAGFYPSQAYAALVVSRKMDSPKTLDRYLLPLAQAGRSRYVLDNQGILNLYNGGVLSYSYRCATVSADAGKYKKGDLMLTGYSRKGKTLLYKVYRHWY